MRLVIGSLALALLVACGGSPRDDANAPLPPVRGRVVRAERLRCPQTVALQGTVEAQRQAALSARVMAVVREVRVKVGDRVMAGQPLLVLDPQVAQGQLGQAQGALAQAEASYALAARNLERYEGLAKVNAAAPLEVDMARTQVAEAIAAVAQARGAVEAARGIAGDAQVVAPFAGRVARRLVEVGDLAAPGRALLVVESEGSSRLRLAIPESLMARAPLAIGAPVSVALDAEASGAPIAATVVELTPGADPASHSFEVLLALARPVPSGAAGRAALPAGTRDVVALPADAVVVQGGLQLVVLVEQGRTGTRAVTTGAPLGDGRVEVLSGLAGGETVLAGLAALPPAGSPVAETTP
jgi:RND family efflux transporter MFP subunit